VSYETIPFDIADYAATITINRADAKKYTLRR
jgi:hypothetical protein